VGVSVKHFNATCRLKKRLRPLFHRINVLLRTVDPTHYKDCEELKRCLMDLHPGYAALAGSDNLTYDGMAILWNVMSQLHTDKQDPIFGWACICIFGGPFTGGELYLPNIGLRLRMQPGDIVFLKGRVVRHMTLDWSGGQRISIPFFTHTSTWKMVKKLADRLRPDIEEDDD
jgi:hypothetical protein